MPTAAQADAAFRDTPITRARLAELEGRTFALTTAFNEQVPVVVLRAGLIFRGGAGVLVGYLDDIDDITNVAGVEIRGRTRLITDPHTIRQLLR
jgi:hypothetical protein